MPSSGGKVNTLSRFNLNSRIFFYLPLILLILILTLVAISLDCQSLDPASVKPFLVAAGMLLLSALLFLFCKLSDDVKCPMKFSLMSDFEVSVTDSLLILLWLVALAVELFFPPAAFGSLYPYTLLILLFYFISRVVSGSCNSREIFIAFASLGIFITIANLIYHFFINHNWYGNFQVGKLTQSFVFDRYVGTMANPNYIASVLLLFLPLYLSGFLIRTDRLFFKGRNKTRGIYSFLWFISDLVFLAGFSCLLILTLCRSSWFFAFLSFPVLIFYLYRERICSASLLILSLVIFFFIAGAAYYSLSTSIKVNFSDTFQKRIVIWKIAASDILESPFVGWGPGGFERVYARNRASGSFLTVKESEASGISSIYVHNFLLQLAGSLGIQVVVPVFVILSSLVVVFWSALFPWNKSKVNVVPYKKADIVSCKKGKAHNDGKGKVHRVGQKVEEIFFHKWVVFSVTSGLLLFLADNLVNVTLFAFPSTLIFFFALAVFESLNAGLPVDKAGLPVNKAVTSQHFENYRNLSSVVFVFVCLTLISVRTWNDYRMSLAINQLRKDGSRVQKEMAGSSRLFSSPPGFSRILLPENNQWFRYTYDLAGKLAIDGELQASLVLYSIVEGHIPDYQSVLTNKSIVRNLLFKE
jgi:O-antigen ligase